MMEIKRVYLVHYDDAIMEHTKEITGFAGCVQQGEMFECLI